MLIDAYRFGGGGGGGLDVSNLFAVVLYTGDGSSTRSINAGIDMTGGGLVEIKPRTAHAGAYIFTDGVAAPIVTSLASTAAGSAAAATFTGTGIDLTDATYNVNARTYVAYFYRKAPRFFDVVGYTGNATNRTVAHGLTVAPGIIITKRTDSTGSYQSYHRDLGAGTRRVVAVGAAASTSDATAWNSTSPTTSVFSLGTSANTNPNTATMWAFLWAHDTAGDSVVQAFSYTGNGAVSPGGSNVSLGWQPQFTWNGRNTSQFINEIDQTRSPGLTGSELIVLYGSTNAESSGDIVRLIAGGVEFFGSAGLNVSGAQYLGFAIRAP